MSKSEVHASPLPPKPSCRLLTRSLILLACVASLFPCLAYIIDMYVRTDGAYGVNEGILSSAIAALTFSLLSVQPLTIVGGESPRSFRLCGTIWRLDDLNSGV